MTPVREIDTGVETFDRARSHRFEAFHAPALSAGEGVWVENVGSWGGARPVLAVTGERASGDLHHEADDGREAVAADALARPAHRPVRKARPRRHLAEVEKAIRIREKAAKLTSLAVECLRCP